MKKMIRVWSIYINPVRSGFARVIRTNIGTWTEVQKIREQLKKEYPKRTFFTDRVWKSQKQLRAQRAFARQRKALAPFAWPRGVIIPGHYNEERHQATLKNGGFDDRV